MPLYRPTSPLPLTQLFTNKSGAYLFGVSSVGTSVTLGNGVLRSTPIYFNTPVTITALGAEFTVAGDAASLFRMTIHNDDGTGYPGTLAQDGGSISTGSGNAGTVATGGTPGVYMNTLGTPLALPAGLFWVGGAVQGVTTTQPTMRIGVFGVGGFAMGTNSVPGAGAVSFGYTTSGVTGTPGTFGAFGGNTSSAVPRVILRLG